MTQAKKDIQNKLEKIKALRDILDKNYGDMVMNLMPYDEYNNKQRDLIIAGMNEGYISNALADSMVDEYELF